MRKTFTSWTNDAQRREDKDCPRRMSASWIGLAATLLLLIAPVARLPAADATFVGKLALVDDPEVAKELALSEETKKKLLELIDKRQQEAIALAAKLRG